MIVLTGKLPQDHFFSVNYSFCILATFCFYKIWKLCFFITYINNKKKALTQTQYCLNVSPPIYPVHWYHLTNTDINLFGFLSHCFPPDVKNIKYYIDWIDNTKLLLAGKYRYYTRSCIKNKKICLCEKISFQVFKKYEDFVILFTNCRRTFTLQCHEYNTKYKVILIMLKNVLIRKCFFFYFVV